MNNFLSQLELLKDELVLFVNTFNKKNAGIASIEFKYITKGTDKTIVLNGESFKLSFSNLTIIGLNIAKIVKPMYDKLIKVVTYNDNTGDFHLKSLDAQLNYRALSVKEFTDFYGSHHFTHLITYSIVGLVIERELVMRPSEHGILFYYKKDREKEIMDFVKQVNKLRKSNKNNWYTLECIVNHQRIRIKGFGTWLQVFKVGGLNVHCAMDLKVNEFTAVLYEGLK